MEDGALRGGNALTHHRTPHAAADLGGVEIKFGEGAAKGVAVHSKFLGRLALVAFVVRQDFEKIAALEMPDSLTVGDAGAMHLRDETVEFALH